VVIAAGLGRKLWNKEIVKTSASSTFKELEKGWQNQQRY
jgi:hypothetical protein